MGGFSKRRRRTPSGGDRRSGKQAGSLPADQIPRPVPRSAPAELPESFDFADLSRRQSQRLPRRRSKKPARGLRRTVVPGLAVICLLMGVALAVVLSQGRPPVITPIDDRRLDELSWLRLTVTLEEAAAPDGPVEFSLAEAPEGASIDRQTGQLAWRPTEQQGPGLYRFVVRACAAESPDRPAQTEFSVLVDEVNQPPVLEPIDDKTAERGTTLAFAVRARDPDVPRRGLNFRLLPGAAVGARLDTDSGRFTWDLRNADPGISSRFTVRVTEAMPNGLSAEESFTVHVNRPAAEIEPAPEIASVGPPQPPPSVVEPLKPQPPPSDAAPSDDSEAQLLELFKRDGFFGKRQYPALREIFAERFERTHREAIQTAYAAQYDRMTQWLDANPVVKEELYTAIDPERDDVVAALRLFCEIRKRFPAELEEYLELAIATVVTWDQPRTGVYDYVALQRRSNSNLPNGRLGAIENFEYLVGGQDFMQLRARWLPWEFLVHVVNHPTPLSERKWAQGQYGHLPALIRFGRCYKDVPYDDEMRRSGGRGSRLSGRDYTLANLLGYGGVCAVQADFAARVGKSLAIPAAYVGGRSRFGVRHAWVSWVELLEVTKDRIAFKLDSEGRYRYDMYYVGHLRDPQTGEEITDRQLELRLQTVGLNPRAKRHAALIMKAYPMIQSKLQTSVPQRLMFLYDVIELCPGNEDAWRAIADMSRLGTVTQKQNKAMMKVLDRLFATFAEFPDFTWTIFDDLVAYQNVPKQRAELYERLLSLYTQAGRPDLTCQARLKYTEHLMADKQYDEAADGLQATIMMFPEEGRYVPQMLDKLEEICRRADGTETRAVELLRLLLPRIPKMRGPRPSQYCMEMYNRGIKLFQGNGQTQAAQYYQAQLAQLTAAGDSAERVRAE